MSKKGPVRFLKRLFGFKEIQRITISRSIIEDLCEMAQGSHPKEMLIFLSSTKGNRDGTVHIDEMQLQAYTASGNSAATALGNIPMTTGIVGTAHSHPGGSTHPSDADLHLFSKFGYVHAIIGEPYREENIKFLDKNGRRIDVGIVL
jgi:proteasome lid subunit RPN8/RPN11